MVTASAKAAPPTTKERITLKREFVPTFSILERAPSVLVSDPYFFDREDESI
jgi:hypothetical protein